MTDKMKKTAEDMSITLTKISISLLFIASIILIALGPWVVNLVIEFPSPFFQGETRFWSRHCRSYLPLYGTDSLFAHALSHCFL